MASEDFLALRKMSMSAICEIQKVYAPGMPLRNTIGMNVRVGKYIAPAGGMAIPGALDKLAYRAAKGGDPWKLHVEFEHLHPFMDGNGRTGRILWAWCMQRTMQDQFALPFLHRFYYQTLAQTHTTGL